MNGPYIRPHTVALRSKGLEKILSKQKFTLGTSVCAAVLTAATILPTAPIAQADPAASTRDNGANQADTKKDKKKLSEFDATQADVDRLLKSPAPKDVDGLIKRLEKISRTAAVTSDLVESTKGRIAKQNEALDKANRDVRAAKAQLDKTQKKVDASRASVSEMSRSAYRGASVDPVSAIAGASGPAAAMDRSAYLTALTRDAQSRMDAVAQDQQDAHAARSKALRTKAQADHRLNELRYQEKKLNERSADLDRLKAEVKTIVDGFSPEDRRRWVDRNGPIDVDVDEFLGKLKKSAGGAAKGNYAGAVAAAMSKLGSPYSWGAAGPDAFDCSGLMVWAYQQIGKSIPRTSQAQLSGGQSVSTSDLQPGDIVAYYPGATHVGMYIGDGQLVHASDYGIPVQVVPVDSMPIVGAVRY